MKPKKLIFWALCALLAYNFFSYTHTHSGGDVVAYKRFAQALLKNDVYTVRHATLDETVTAKVLQSQSARTQRFHELKIIFTYYVIKERTLSNDGQRAWIIAEQVSRVDPPGVSTVWGARAVRIRHAVELVKKDGLWRIAKFLDSVIQT